MGDNDESKRAPPTRRGSSSSSRRNRRRQRRSDRPGHEDDPSVTTATGVDREQQQQDQESQQEQEYYDHNRNHLTKINHDREKGRALQEPGDHYHEHRRELELKSLLDVKAATAISTIATTETETETETTSTRYRENVSPVSSPSLSTQSGTDHCEPYETCQLNSSGACSSTSDHSTERMSQTSLANAAAAAAAAATTIRMTNEGSQQEGERVVKFQVGEVIELGRQKQHTAITIQEQEEELAATKTGGRSASLVRQLGRRVSLFPQALARQMTWRDDQPRLSDDHRRYSLQPVPRGGGGGGGGGEATTTPDIVDEMSPLHSSASPTQHPEVPITVAGVGGTITTVTRSKRKTAPLPRLVAKNGQVNLFLDNIDRSQYMRDLFTTMIDIKWRYNLMAAAFGFVFSWLFFACIWYLVLYFHNDLEHENDPNWSPCIVNVYSFPAALLFSIETQSTLGFGSRIISVECPGAILIFCSQLIFGVVVECLIVGMVFAKLSRPTKRSQTIMYSKYATVCLREGKMCLTFRVGDVRSKSHIIGATLRASLVSSKVTQEGEIIPFYHHKLQVIIDDCKNSLLLIWPVTIVHVIDESSPFYKLNADELINFKFEIITVLEGTVESTGQSIQVRSSYLPSEVKWGYRFEPIVSTHGYGRYAQTIIDYNKFNRIVEVPTPKCSPLEYYADQATIGLCSGGGGGGGDTDTGTPRLTTTTTTTTTGDNRCPNGDNQQVVPNQVVLV